MSEFEEKVRAAFDAELKTAQARPGLRQRVIANAVATPRRRGISFTAWLSPPRLALVGAAAAVLVVAGVGIRLATTQRTTVVAQHSPTPAPVLAFGKLPAPQLHPPIGLGGGGGGPTVVPYFGPATMTWSGQLPQVPISAPVYRFSLPTPADEDAFAARIGAKPQGNDQFGRTYRGPDGFIMFIGTEPDANEPVFIMNLQASPSGGQPVNEAGARAVADAELAHLGLTPSWSFSVQVSSFAPVGQSAPMYTLTYQRVIRLSNGLIAGEVDGNGDPSGIQVMVDANGNVIRLAGPLRLAEQSAKYPIRSGTSATRDAINAPPVFPGSGPVPAVTLTKATLVYTVTHSDNTGYMEPAYLFTGTFPDQGVTSEKRVLVSALAPSGVSG